MIFEWDEEKYHANWLKHWIRFDQAAFVWEDPFSIEFLDNESSHLEERFLKIGHCPNIGLLAVIFCEREDGNVMRIISARKATKSERGMYER